MKWYLTEFCYLVNSCTFLFVWLCLLKKFVPQLAFLKPLLDPHGSFFFRIAFAWSLGPVALSIAAFRNSLIFHSLGMIPFWEGFFFLLWFPDLLALPVFLKVFYPLYVLYRNSVFICIHKPDHMGSVAIHLGPPLLCYSMRFYHAEVLFSCYFHIRWF